MTRNRALLVLVGLTVLGLAVAPGAVAADGELDVHVEQADDGSATVSVGHNGSAAANASVTVESTDENVTYAGAGEYTADENGTVALPAPETAVNVSVTATVDNHSASTEAHLAASEAENETGDETADAFGQLVSAFVQDAQNDTDGGIGPAVASFVHANSPAADVIPDHAGPPEHVFGDTNATQGPPEHAGPGGENETDGEQGPPEHASPGGDDGDGNGSENGNGGQGPPDHAGGGDEGADDEEDEDAE